MMSNSQRRSVLVLGHFGAGNLGDELMLQGLLTLIADHWPGTVHARVVWKGNYALKSPEQAQISTEEVPPAPLPLLRALLRSDAMVLGGGTHFHDDYPFPRLFRHWRYLARYILVQAIARAAGKRVTWLGVGIGPIKQWPTRWLTRIAVRQCGVIHVRDQASAHTIRITDPRLRSPVVIGADLAHYVACDLTPTLEHLTSGVAVVPTRLWRLPHNKSLDYWRWLGRELASLLKPTGAQVTLVAARSIGRESDVAEVAAVREGLEERGHGHSRLISFDGSVPDFLRALGESAVKVIAARFHAVIAATLVGKTVLAVAYHEKVEHIAGELGVPSLHGDLDRDRDELVRFLRAAPDPISTKMKRDLQRDTLIKSLDHWFGDVI